VAQERRVLSRPVVMGENPANHVFVDFDVERQGDLLGDSRTAPVGITSLHSDDCADEFCARSLLIDWHLRGTRYQIHVDPEDSLLFAGQPHVQLTWMDAKVGEWVVTPRIGKPIEINALWLNALYSMMQFVRLLGRPTAGYACLAKRARAGFGRFWNEAKQCCFDVLDGPTGNDPAIRPNQIFAVSLPESALTPEQQRAVVETCARRLLTSHGLRSLDPDDPQYRGHYGGSQFDRDGSYYQGTVWGWLLGPFVLAHLRVYRHPREAPRFLEPIEQYLRVHGLGSISEIFDGDPPFTPRGCIAQAWSVGEVLRAWSELTAALENQRPELAVRCNAWRWGRETLRRVRRHGVGSIFQAEPLKAARGHIVELIENLKRTKRR
jgi:glycogen debranching enzyme